LPGTPAQTSSKSPTLLPSPLAFTGSEGGKETQAFKTPKQSFRSKGIQKVSLQLQNAKSHKALKTTDNTIPAGAFAQAVLMGGVDASTSIGLNYRNGANANWGVSFG
jgi:hypothetical protein